MPFIKHIIILFLVNSLLQAHTFTSSDGVRKIEASITSYDEKSEIVSIVRNDGKSFNTKLSSFSAKDQAYVLKWLEGTKENYLYVGKEYPGHLQMYLKILNSGGIGYGQTILYRPGMAPLIIGNGATVGAGSTVTRDVSENELVISRAKERKIANWQRPVKKK